jgi:diaminopimelate decarboxylase
MTDIDATAQPDLYQSATSGEYLRRIITETDMLSVDSAGDLMVEGCGAASLLQTFGSPLHIISEATLRLNYRRMFRMLAKAWGNRVGILYAIKANPHPAVRAILNQEGAGGDCFGYGEIFATFAGGADPRMISLNGANKTRRDLDEAVRRGIQVNVDDVGEVAELVDICTSRNASVRVSIRLKILPEEYKDRHADYFGGREGAYEQLASWKWGFSEDSAANLVARILAEPRLQLTGYMAHTGRVRNDPASYAEYTREFGRTVVALYERTGFWPPLIDIGGGWARRRDPESRSYVIGSFELEDHIDAAMAALKGELSRTGMPVPELWTEPGRAMVGNAGLLLGTIGRTKEDLGRCWVSVDISTNNLVRIDTSASAYHVLSASAMDRPFDGKALLVGPTCTESVINPAWRTPRGLRPGEAVAVLDTGMYSEAVSNQFNSIPRPATVLVSGGDAELIRERETVEDLFDKCIVPARLKRN